MESCGRHAQLRKKGVTVAQSRSQSLRSPCPAERETRDSGIKLLGSHSHWLNICACVTDFGSDGAGNEQQNGGKDPCEGFV